MHDQAIRSLDMLKRVRVFENAHGGNFAAGSLARQLFDAARQAIDEVETYAGTKSAAGGTRRLNTAGKEVARETLRAMLEAIRRTARAMAFTVPGMGDKFRIPRGAGDQTLINTARAFVQEALPLKAEFIRHEMPPTFIEDLQAAIDALENATRDQTAAQGIHKSAVISIDETIGRGIEAVRRLDPIVRNKFADQAHVLGEWHSARHIERGPRSQRNGGGNNTNQPPTP